MRTLIAAALLSVPAAAATMVAAPSPTLAQSFQTALPVSPAERRAIETRLSTILDYSAPDEVNRFQLPSGRTVIVRPYRVVPRQGNQPCRGYRIDLHGSQSSTAVDGFRCKRRDGLAWVIVEPELVLAQEGPQIAAIDPPAELARAADEPIYPADEGFADAAPPPVPRPAPRSRLVSARAATEAPTTQTPATQTPATQAPGTETLAGTPAPAESAPTQDDRHTALTSRIAAAIGTDTQAPPADTPATAPQVDPAAAPAPEGEAAQSTIEPLPEILPPPEPQETAALATRSDVPDGPASPREVLPTLAPAATRVVGEPDTAAGADWSSNEDVVAALQDLDYLATEVEPTGAAVEAAVDAFAIDERFALPIPQDLLLERLDAAIERSETLPTCGEGAQDLCLEAAVLTAED